MINKFYILVTLIVFSMITSSNLCAGDNISIFPQPKEVTLKSFKVSVKNYYAIIVDMSDTAELFLARYLKQKLNEKYNVHLPIVRVNSATKLNGIMLGNFSKSNIIKNICLTHGVEIDNNLNKEGYILDVLNENIFIVGTDSAGIFYGIQSLLQLIDKNNSDLFIQGVRIKDYPTSKIRAVYVNAANLEKLKGQLGHMSELKMNTIIFENWAYFNLNKDDNREKLVDIFNYAREHFIEPIPHLVSFSYAGPILSKDPSTAEGIWAEDRRFKFVNDEAMPLNPSQHSLINVIRSDDSNITIKNLESTRTYRENVDYKVIDGVMSYPFSLDNRPTKIIRIQNGNIKDGDEVLVSYDYVERKTTSWATWTAPYCPSSERTYEIMFDALENVIEAVNPKYIAIGHDEILGMNRDSRCRKRKLNNAELLADDINKLNNFVKSIDSNIRLLMWDDMVNPWHNGGNENLQVQFGGIPGKTSDAIGLIPHDMIMMVWWYDPNDSRNKMKNSPDFFETEGFDYLVAGYRNKKNITDWAKLSKNKSRCLGIIATVFEGWENNIEGIRYTAEVGWR